MKEEIVERLRISGVDKKVYMPNKIAQEDMPKYYNAADLYVSASQTDGSSVSLMDAFACGLPAVVSDIEGNEEWIMEDMNGWMFKVGDADAFSHTIQKAIRQKTSLAEMGRRARKTVEEKANWQDNFQKLLLAYQLAIDVGGRPRMKILPLMQEVQAIDALEKIFAESITQG